MNIIIICLGPWFYCNGVVCCGYGYSRPNVSDRALKPTGQRSSPGLTTNRVLVLGVILQRVLLTSAILGDKQKNVCLKGQQLSFPAIATPSCILSISQCIVVYPGN